LSVFNQVIKKSVVGWVWWYDRLL